MLFEYHSFYSGSYLPLCILEKDLNVILRVLISSQASDTGLHRGSLCGFCIRLLR